MEPLSIASNVSRDNSNKGVNERPTDNPMPVGPTLNNHASTVRARHRLSRHQAG